MSDLQISSLSLNVRPQQGLAANARAEEQNATRVQEQRPRSQESEGLTLTEKGLLNDQFKELPGEVVAITTADDIIDLSRAASEEELSAEQEQLSNQPSLANQAEEPQRGQSLDLLA